jgi:ATP-binding cassette, subfamily B, bacterial
VRRGVRIVDPATGPRVVSLRELGRCFTGLALAFEKAPDFRTGDSRPRGLPWHARELLKRWPSLAHVALVSMVVTLCAMATPLLMTALVDRVLPQRDQGLLAVAGLGIAVAVVLHFLGSLVRGGLLLHLRTHLDLELSSGFLEHLVRLPYEFFQTRSRGDLLLRLGSNAEVREILTSGTLSTLLDGIFVIAYLGVLFALNATMASIALALAAVQMGVLVLSSGPQRRLTTEYLQAQARCNGQQIELLGGIEALKSMGQERRVVERWSTMFVEVLNASTARGRLSTLTDAALSALRLLAPLGLTWFGVGQVLAGRLPLGTMLAVVSLAMAFLGPLSSLLSMAMRFATLASHLDRIDDVLRTPAEPRRGAAITALRGAIRLDHASFRYATASPLILDDLDFEIEPGAFVAVVGPSGAGKSTLARLLAGLHAPTSGRVLYDGVPLDEVDLQSLRSRLGVVTQQPQLFGLSVRSNIAFADPTAPLEAVCAAARTARIHDEIVAMPMGYDTVIGDGGGALSGGQRQRLALARALLLRPSVLILDEATSALDAVTEKAIQEELARLDCTRIVMAHRLSSVMDADLVLVMQDGRVVERGRHDDLMAANGAYRRLVAAQVEGLPGAWRQERSLRAG